MAPPFQCQGKLSAVDRPALPKEDLFDTSTMTFGEHLDELRRSLARAIIWLVAGALIALVFAAKPVVRMIQGPLETAIIEYNADRSLTKMGYDIEDDAVKEGELRRWMLKNGMAWELVYVLPKEFSKIKGNCSNANFPITRPSTISGEFISMVRSLFSSKDEEILNSSNT